MKQRKKKESSKRLESSDEPDLGSVPREIKIDHCAMQSEHLASSTVGEDEQSSSLSPNECKSLTLRAIGLGKTLVLFSVTIVLLMTLVETQFFRKDPLEDFQEAVRDRLQSVFPHFHHFNESITSLAATLHQSTATEKQSVGALLSQQGAEVHFPIVMIPGFVTSGLEVWAAKDCLKRLFRQRVWTAFTGAASLLVEKDCWVEHMMLDPVTGGDPENIRVRAAEGFIAADYFLMNYWVWGKLIENLAQIGYTPSNMVMLPYDWRLPFELLEERDGYLSELKGRIESLHKRTGRKVIIATHSMGALLSHHFFGWVTSPERDGGGGGGKHWVDKHVESYINIAGPHLGVPKAATALLSGEMKDTVFGGRIATFVEHFFPRRLRRDLFNSWGSLWAMLPKGGNKLWAVGNDMCDDRTESDPFCPVDDQTPSPLIAMTDVMSASTEFSVEEAMMPYLPLLKQLLADDAHLSDSLLTFLQNFGSGLGPNTAGSRFHSQLGRRCTKRSMWYDPTRYPLPHAPNMRIFCLYGTGLPTERGYYYKRNLEDSPGGLILEQPPLVIDTEATDTNATFGIRNTDGDGSVPLISLGYICADAWQRRNSGLNPSRTKVFTREYEHKSEFNVEDPMRRGPTSADHVDILGNSAMIGDFIRIVSDFETSVVNDNRITSKILEIAAAINDHPNGGLFRHNR